MKNIVRTAKYFLLCTAAVALAACSEKKMDEINADNAHTLDANAKFIIPDLELRGAQDVVGGDLNTYAGCYIEHWTGSWNQLYYAEIRDSEVKKTSTFDNVWTSAYRGISNAKTVIAKTQKGGSDVDDLLARAIGEIMLAYYASITTDAWGDTPFAQTGDVVKYPAPCADTQKSIYDEVFKLLDDAIELLEDPDVFNSVGANDLIYGGNIAKWEKFAYGLKARYTLRLIGRTEDKAAAYTDVIDFLDNSFESDADNAAVMYDSGNQNPLFDVQFSIDAISSSRSMYNKLMARQDPRAERVYFDSYDWFFYSSEEVEEKLPYNGAPSQCQYEYPYDVFSYAEIAPVYFLSYMEECFMRAEALVGLGQLGQAKAALKEGVEQAFSVFEINVDAAMKAPTILDYGGLEDISEGALTKDDADAYFTASVEPLFDAEPLKEVMIQKYIAMWGANGGSVETYNDVRRMMAAGNDFYDLENIYPDKFPQRVPYGTGDVVNNPNIKKLHTDGGNYVFKEPVWWAGGTR